MKTRGIGHSDVGRSRKNNEDSFHVEDELGLYIVSDGMGGHRAGEVASRIAVEVAAEHIRANQSLLSAITDETRPVSELLTLVEEAVERAAGAVYEAAQSDPERAGMGCTLTLLLVAKGSGALAHVGDSRLYLRRGGTVSQLTCDHTVAAELVRSGLMTKADMVGHRYASTLSRVVGPQPAVKPETLLFDLAPDERLLLCSDGFSNYIEDNAQLHSLMEGDIDLAAVGLVAFANDAGGGDNITAVLVETCPEQTKSRRLRNIEQRYGALRSVFLFDELDLKLLTRVMGTCDLEVYEQGQEVIAEGEKLNDLVVVVEGRCALRRGDDDLGELLPGEHTGVTSLYNPRCAQAQLSASEPSTLLRLRGARLRSLARRRPWLGIGLLERLSRQLSRDIERSYGQRSGSGERVEPGQRL